MSDFRPPPPLLYEPLVAAALREDLRRSGDVTTDAVVPADAVAVATWWRVGKGGWPAWRSPAGPSPCSTPGWRWSSRRPTAMTWPRTVLAVWYGPARAILSAEPGGPEHLLGRSAVSPPQTRRVVALVAGTGGRVPTPPRPPRGSGPGEVRRAHRGDRNHRFGLDDAVLIKDNHVAVPAGWGGGAPAKAAVGHLVKCGGRGDQPAQVSRGGSTPGPR